MAGPRDMLGAALDDAGEVDELNVTLGLCWRELCSMAKRNHKQARAVMFVRLAIEDGRTSPIRGGQGIVLSARHDLSSQDGGHGDANKLPGNVPRNQAASAVVREIWRPATTVTRLQPHDIKRLGCPRPGSRELMAKIRVFWDPTPIRDATRGQSHQGRRGSAVIGSHRLLKPPEPSVEMSLAYAPAPSRCHGISLEMGIVPR